MKKFINSITPLILSLLLFFFLEILCRAFFYRGEQLGNYGYNVGGLGDLLPNRSFIDSTIESMPYKVVTNSQGLRNEEEIDFSPSTTRILSIGDSFTYGPYVNNQDTWSAILQRKLNSDPGINHYQVLNAGVAGYTIIDELEYLNDKGLKIKPNLIILGIYANDINDLRPEKRNIYARSLQVKRETSLNGKIRKIVRHIALANIIQKKKLLVNYQQYFSPPILKEKDEDLYFDMYKEYLKHFIQIAEKDNSKLLVLLFPEVEQLKKKDWFFQDRIISYLKEMNTSYIDLSPFFINKDEKDLYLLPLNTHLAVYGYQYTAELVIEYLKSNKVIRKNIN